MSVDGNALTRRRLFRAVAMAAGRAFEEQSVPLSGSNGAAFEPPTRDEALHCGQLVLIAEDNETNQKVVLRQLALLGVAADAADNGRLALELWRSGNYALLLSDIHMPVMDGYELTAAIRAQEKGRTRVPIVALTAMGALALGELCAEIECAGNSNGGSEALTLLMPTFEQELHAVNTFLDSLKVRPAGRRQNK